MTKNTRDFVAPLEIAFPIDGCDLVITPLRVIECAQLLALAESIFDELLSVDPDMLERIRADAASAADLVWLMRLISREGETVLDGLALCTRSHSRMNADLKPEIVTGVEHAAWVRALLPDRAIELLMTCIQVNADFFARAMPRLRELASPYLKPAAPPASSSAGTTPSTS